MISLETIFKDSKCLLDPKGVFIHQSLPSTTYRNITTYIVNEVVCVSRTGKRKDIQNPKSDNPCIEFKLYVGNYDIILRYNGRIYRDRLGHVIRINKMIHQFIQEEIARHLT